MVALPGSLLVLGTTEGVGSAEEGAGLAGRTCVPLGLADFDANGILEENCIGCIAAVLDGVMRGVEVIGKGLVSTRFERESGEAAEKWLSVKV